MRRWSWFVGLLLACCLLGAPAAGAARAEAGPHLKWLEISLGGKPLKVADGGVVAIHPDAPFRVVGMDSDAWLDFGLRARVKGQPGVDLSRFHTLSELLGPKVYEDGKLTIEVLDQGRVIGAVRLVPRLLPIDWLRRARAARSLEERIACLRRAWELSPDDRLLFMRLVELLVEAGRYRQAAELVESQPAGDDPRLLETLAGVYEHLGQWDKAAATLSKLAADRPRDRGLLARLAELYQKRRRWDEAAQAWERLLSLQQGPERAQTLLKLARVYQQAGRSKQAAQTLEAAARLRPHDSRLWRELARIRAAAGDQAAAVAALQRAVELEPADRDLRLRLARALLEAGEKARAAAQMEAASRLGPEDLALLGRLAALYQELGDRAALARTYRRMLQIRPDDADLHYNLGLLYQKQKDYPRALEELQAAARLRPQDQEVARAVLEVLLAAGRDKQVLAQARRMLQARPQDLEVIDRIYPRLSRKRPRGLARLLDWRLKQGKVPVKYYKLRAALALEQEDTKGAIAALARGVEAWPEDLGLRLRLAELYDAQGQEAEALAQLNYITDKDPEFPGAEELYLQIKTRTLKAKIGHPPGPASGEGASAPAAEPPLPRENITPPGGSPPRAGAGAAEATGEKGAPQTKAKPEAEPKAGGAPPSKAEAKGKPSPGDKGR